MGKEAIKPRSLRALERFIYRQARISEDQYRRWLADREKHIKEGPSNAPTPFHP
jgi:hypothetical protein